MKDKKKTKSINISLGKRTKELSKIKNVLHNRTGIPMERLFSKNTPLDVLREVTKYVQEVRLLPPKTEEMEETDVF